MTERTLSGRTRRRAANRSRKPKAKSVDGKPDADLGAVTWSFALLLVSVALAAAAVFTKKPF